MARARRDDPSPAIASASQALLKLAQEKPSLSASCEVLKEMLPAARRFGVLGERTISVPTQLQAVAHGARMLGVELQTIDLGSPGELTTAIAAFAAGGAEGLFLLRPGSQHFEHFTIADGLTAYVDETGPHQQSVVSVAGGPAGGVAPAPLATRPVVCTWHTEAIAPEDTQGTEGPKTRCSSAARMSA